MQEQLEADPLVNVIADYLTVSRRHRHRITAHVEAQGRLGRDVSNFVAPLAEQLTIEDLIRPVVERIAEGRVDAERQELHQRREAAGNDTKETPMSLTDTLIHEPYCLPRPGEDTARVERYTQPRYDQGGTRVLAYVSVVRCIECGASSYDGQRG